MDSKSPGEENNISVDFQELSLRFGGADQDEFIVLLKLDGRIRADVLFPMRVYGNNCAFGLLSDMAFNQRFSDEG